MTDAVIDNAPLFAERQTGFLPGILDMEWETMRHGLVRGRVTVARDQGNRQLRGGHRRKPAGPAQGGNTPLALGRAHR